MSRHQGLAGVLRWFNHNRLHSSIGYLPPVEFEQYHATPKAIDLTSGAAEPTLRRTQR